jgi:CRP-like cAMP-binding protein
LCINIWPTCAEHKSVDEAFHIEETHTFTKKIQRIFIQFLEFLCFLCVKCFVDEENIMSIIDDLRKIPLFAHMLEEGKQCPVFVTNGEEVHVASGERLAKEGEDAAFYVVLEGSLQVLKKTEDGEMLLATHAPGNFFGELPLLLGVGFFASGKAVAPTRVWKLDENAFWQMLASCPLVTREIMRTMATRTRAMESIDQSAERLISLGTMAAGWLTNSTIRRRARFRRRRNSRKPPFNCPRLRASCTNKI